MRQYCDILLEKSRDFQRKAFSFGTGCSSFFVLNMGSYAFSRGGAGERVEKCSELTLLNKWGSSGNLIFHTLL